MILIFAGVISILLLDWNLLGDQPICGHHHIVISQSGRGDTIQRTASVISFMAADTKCHKCVFSSDFPNQSINRVPAYFFVSKIQ